MIINISPLKPIITSSDYNEHESLDMCDFSGIFWKCGKNINAFRCKGAEDVRHSPKSWHRPAICTQSISCFVMKSSGCLSLRALTRHPAKYPTLQHTNALWHQHIESNFVETMKSKQPHSLACMFLDTLCIMIF